MDEFLSTAELAAKDFTADRYNSVKIISQPSASSVSGLPISSFTAHNPYLLSPQEREEIEALQRINRGKLTVPRRPRWEKGITAQELDRMEKDNFLEWRRQLAQLQDNQDLLMTPFERNIEVWRQLWRVIERSDLVVQIVDARNPLFFRSEDLETYVKEYDNGIKHNLLLINKADLLSPTQRQAWANYFHKNGIRYAFFSAFTALQEQEADIAKQQQEEEERKRQLEEEEDDSSDEEDEEESEEEEDDDDNQSETKKEQEKTQTTEKESNEQTPVREILKNNPIHILSVNQLEELFLTEVPPKQREEEEEEEEEDTSSRKNGNHKKPKKFNKTALNIGLVGYPNVGKSSTINALIGAKKVSVSATPGKTKHFQTIQLSKDVTLCDCPGLVFPNFSNTNAELVCNGVLPIDQLREFTGPTDLVTQRIPKFFLEAIYGITIYIKPIPDGGSGIPTAQELLYAYARARGFMRAGKGTPDESRAARYILKDYVTAKLLYCHPPPDWKPSTPDELLTNEKLRQLPAFASMSPEEIAGRAFNSQLYSLKSLPEARRTQILLAIAKKRYGEKATLQTLLQETQKEKAYHEEGTTVVNNKKPEKEYDSEDDLSDEEDFEDDDEDYDEEDLDEEELNKKKPAANYQKITLSDIIDGINLAEELESLSFSQHISFSQMKNSKNKSQLSAMPTANSQGVVSVSANFDNDFFQTSALLGHRNLPFHQQQMSKKGGKKGAKIAELKGNTSSKSKKAAKKKRRAGAGSGTNLYSDLY